MLRYARGNRTSAVGRLRGRRNERERRTTTAAPPTLFRSSTSPLPRQTNLYLLAILSLLNPSTPTSSISLSHFLSLTFAFCCLFEFAVTLIYTHTYISYIALYVPADVCMRSMCCICYWYSLYVKYQSKRIRRRAHKYLCSQCWVRQS